MRYLFYDTETTGLSWAFDQILQFAAIVTDDKFEVLEELNLRCRLQRHVLPSPGAMAVTGIGPNTIQAAPLSFYELAGAVRQFIERWTPTVVTGFNSVAFDEPMLRGMFYQTLHPLYLTNTNGNCRMDVLRLAHAVAEHRPDAITVPLSEQGRPCFKLGALIEANGLRLDNAHDALADTRATVALAKFLKAGAPEVWEGLFACRSRHTVDALLSKNELFLCTDRMFSKATILAGEVARHPDNPATLAVFDLACDPAPYLDADLDQASALLKSSPRPVRVIRSNALPIILPLTPGRDTGVDPKLARERLVRIKAHPTFCRFIARALAGQYEDAELRAYVEQRMYEGFPSPAECKRMDQFHRLHWPRRYELAQGFEDGRLRELAERLIYSEHPEALPGDRRAVLDHWRHQRFVGSGNVPWLTLARAFGEVEEIRADTDPLLLAEIELWLQAIEAELPVSVEATSELGAATAAS
jgi:exodeoxyribonuclease-1